MAEAATTDSSPALLSEAVAALNTTERAHWKLTGELPSLKDDTSRTPNADPSPASPAEPAAETAATPSADSEPAPSNKKRGNASTRNAELDSEINELQAKLKLRKQLRDELDRTALQATPSSRDAQPADSSPAAEGLPPADLLRSPDVTQPPMEEDAWFQAYPKSTLGQFTRYQTRYEALRMQAESKQREAQDTAQSRYRTHYEKARQADPDLPTKLPERFLKASPVIQAQAGPLNFAAREIQDSEHGDAMLVYLGEHPEEIDRLETLPDPAAVIRAMARLEARVSSSTSPQPTPAKRGISAAPAPTTSMGRRATAPADEGLAAVADGDVRRFIDVENRKELARKHFRA